MTIYFDTCALNRLTDDQTQPRIIAEADAVERAFELVESGAVQWIASDTLRKELSANRDIQKRDFSLPLLDLASGSLEITPAVFNHVDPFIKEGFGSYDALHLAHCQLAGVDFLLTVDDRLIRRFARRATPSRLQVLNPIDWIARRNHAG